METEQTPKSFVLNVWYVLLICLFRAVRVLILYDDITLDMFILFATIFVEKIILQNPIEM